MTITSDDIKRLAREAGFDLCGITAPSTLPSVRRRYEDWLANGYHADMGWMAASRERRCDPTALMKDLRSIIMLGVNYYQENSEDVPEGHGRVSRYARGRDYHKVIGRMTKDFLRRIVNEVNREVVRKEQPDFKWWVDYGPMLERAWAEKAGLGYIGKNSMLINRQFGSWIFLSEVLTSLELKPDAMWAGEHGRCKSCRRCIDACPTGAIVDEGVIDSRRCLSYLTIEHRSEIPQGQAEKVTDQIFGCDICQEVCPHNQARSVPTKHEELTAERGVGEFLNAKDVLALQSREEFLELTAGTALTRPKLEGLQRNAKIILKGGKKQDS